MTTNYSVYKQNKSCIIFKRYNLLK